MQRSEKSLAVYSVLGLLFLAAGSCGVIINLPLNPATNFAVGPGRPVNWGCKTNTTFSSIHLDLNTMLINTADFSGANTTTVWGTGCTLPNHFGTAFDCEGTPVESRIDLTGTGYKISDTWTWLGDHSNGSVTFSCNNQVANISIRGTCAINVPALQYAADPSGATGGWFLHVIPCPVSVVYLDMDGDGYGSSTPQKVCWDSLLAGYSTVGGDCNDTNPAVHPEAVESVCSSVDFNCDGSTKQDGDTCDDGNLSTVNDHCSNGSCIGTLFANAGQVGLERVGYDMFGTPFALEFDATADTCRQLCNTTSGCVGWMVSNPLVEGCDPVLLCWLKSDIPTITQYNKCRISAVKRTVCGDGICNAPFETRDNCFADCHSIGAKLCQHNPAPLGGIQTGVDTLGGLISNQLRWLVPGIEHLTHGIKIVDATERTSPLFSLCYDSSSDADSIQDTASGTIYQIPKGIAVDTLPLCNFGVSSEEVSSASGMASSMAESASISVNVGASYSGWGVSASANYAFAQEKSVKEARKLQQRHKGKMFRATAECLAYTVVTQPSQLTFHPHFLQALNEIQTIDDVLPVMEQFGTHFYESAQMGGRLTMLTSTSTSYSSSASQASLQQKNAQSFSAAASGWGASASAAAAWSDARASDSSNQQEYEEATEKTDLLVYGGQPGSFSPSGDSKDGPSSWGTWAVTVADAPVPLNYKLRRIGDILGSSWVNKNGIAVKNAWNTMEPVFHQQQATLLWQGNRYTILLEFNPFTASTFLGPFGFRLEGSNATGEANYFTWTFQSSTVKTQVITHFLYFSGYGKQTYFMQHHIEEFLGELTGIDLGDMTVLDPTGASLGAVTLGPTCGSDTFTPVAAPIATFSGINWVTCMQHCQLNSGCGSYIHIQGGNSCSLYAAAPGTISHTNDWVCYGGRYDYQPLSQFPITSATVIDWTSSTYKKFAPGSLASGSWRSMVSTTEDPQIIVSFRAAQFQGLTNAFDPVKITLSGTTGTRVFYKGMEEISSPTDPYTTFSSGKTAVFKFPLDTSEPLGELRSLALQVISPWHASDDITMSNSTMFIDRPSVLVLVNYGTGTTVAVASAEPDGSENILFGNSIPAFIPLFAPSALGVQNALRS